MGFISENEGGIVHRNDVTKSKFKPNNFPVSKSGKSF